MKRLPARQGLQWLNESLAIWQRDGRRFFGISLMFLSITFTLILMMQLPVLLSGEPQAGEISPVPFVVAQLLLSLLLPLLMAGWFRMFQAHFSGRPSGTAVFFQHWANLRMVDRLVRVGLVGVGSFLLSWLLMRALFSVEYTDVLLGKANPQTLGTGRFLACQAITLAVSIAAYALLLFSIPRVALQDVSPWPALRDSLGACLANFLPLLVFFALFTGLMIVVALIVGLVMVLVVAVLAVLAKISSAVALVLGSVALLVFLLAFAWALPLAYLPNYLMWRDVFGNGAERADAPPSAPDTIAL